MKPRAWPHYQTRCCWAYHAGLQSAEVGGTPSGAPLRAYVDLEDLDSNPCLPRDNLVCDLVLEVASLLDPLSPRLHL